MNQKAECRPKARHASDGICKLVITMNFGGPQGSEPKKRVQNVPLIRPVGEFGGIRT